MSPDNEWPAAVAGFPQQADTKKTVRRFLRLSVYYRRIVKNFVDIPEPLTTLTIGVELVMWKEKQQVFFNDLTNRFQAAPVHVHFEKDVGSELHMNSTNVGLGGVLVERQHAAERVVAHGSRTPSKA